MKVKIREEKEVEITKEDFQSYEEVRLSGLTNMFDLRNVEMLSGLPREKIKAIIENYEQLEKEYSEVD